MENASKALIMAAEVLIAMVILSLAMYLVITFGNFSQQVHEQNAEIELTKFNSQFTQFEAMDTVTIYDIVTVANYARENNQRYELELNKNVTESNMKSTYYVKVNLKTKTGTQKNNLETLEQKELDKLLSNDYKNMSNGNSNLPIYKCTTTTSDITGRVYIVYFE